MLGVGHGTSRLVTGSEGSAKLVLSVSNSEINLHTLEL